MIAAQSDTTVDDQLSCAECEEVGQLIVVIKTAALANGVAGSTGWSKEVQRD